MWRQKILQRINKKVGGIVIKMKNNKKIELKNGAWATKKDILDWLKQQLIDNLNYEVDDEGDAFLTDKDWHNLAINLIKELKEEDE